MGRPVIQVCNGNYRNRGELYLQHKFNGPELKISHARDTLENLFRLWRRPVHVETVLDDIVTILSFDGSEHHDDQTDQAVE
jgi:stage V sporulation protein R